ncbi:MAG: DUF1573 domain-containing protein [Opitutaceae bacterium]|nr:DUF1573 domain-containing protein [Opitutaceae bacterium]
MVCLRLRWKENLLLMTALSGCGFWERVRIVFRRLLCIAMVLAGVSLTAQDVESKQMQRDGFEAPSSNQIVVENLNLEADEKLPHLMRGTWHVHGSRFYFADNDESQAIRKVLDFSWSFDDLRARFASEFLSFDTCLEKGRIKIGVVTDRVRLEVDGASSIQRVVTRAFIDAPNCFTSDYSEAAKRAIAHRSSSRFIARPMDYIDGPVFHRIISRSYGAFSGITVSHNQDGPENESSDKKTLHWETQVIDVSSQAESKEARAVFSFKNTGYRLVILNQVTTDCECAEVKLAQQTFCPGEAGKIEIRIDRERCAGTKMVSVIVATDDPEAPTVLLVIKVAP